MTNRFNAISQAGVRYVLVEHGSSHNASHLKSSASVPGMGELFTEDGGRVNDMGDGRFKIVATGEILRLEE